MHNFYVLRNLNIYLIEIGQYLVCRPYHLTTKK